MRFGLALPQYDFSLAGQRQVSWRSVSDWALRAEQMGFDSVWVSDHVIWDISKYGGPSNQQGLVECFTALAALAAVTSRVRIGSLVVCNDVRPPSLVAKMAGTIDALSGGRLDIGIGAGWYEPEFVAMGIPFRSAPERVDRMAEAVRILRGMLSEEQQPFSFEGRHYRVEDAWNLPLHHQRRVPVWVGGKGDQVVRIAGRYADGYNMVWAVDPKSFASRVDLLERAAERGGRDPRSVSRSVGLYVLPGSDKAEVEERWNRYRAASPKGVGEGMDPYEWGSDKLIGSPSEMEDRIDAFGRLGVEEVILGFGLLPFQIADEQAVEWFAREVIPMSSTS